jgi:hypothetical protein
VQWTGTDVGAGIRDFTLYVSDDGGAFNALLTNTASTSAIFTGQPGHTYAFYSIAHDLVGNVEAGKTVAEANTVVVTDVVAPTTTALLSPMPNAAAWNNSNVTVGLTAADNANGSGVKQITYSVAGAQVVPSTTVGGNAASIPIVSEGISVVTFFATDNAGNIEVATSLTVRFDKTPPKVTAPADQTVNQTTSSGAVVNYPAPIIVETGSGLSASSCLPASGSVFAIGTTTVTCTAMDLAGNAASAVFKVTVAPFVSLDGRMYGVGFINQDGQHQHFVFRVAQIRNQDYGRFEYWANESRFCGRDDDDDRDPDFNGGSDRDYGRDHRNPPSHFEATSITSVIFSDDPAFQPGRGPRPTVDTVKFSGAGKWNGRPGYTFEVTASDRGEPGRQRDTFSLLVKDSRGNIVASVNRSLDAGNIQSTRLSR